MIWLVIIGVIAAVVAALYAYDRSLQGSIDSIRAFWLLMYFIFSGTTAVLFVAAIRIVTL